MEHGLEVTKHLRHLHLGTKGDMAWVALCWSSTAGSGQGHFKVKPAIILNKNIFLQFPYVFAAK